jgi:hypothetical protein
MPAKYLVKIKCTTLFDITRSGVNTRRQEQGVTDLSYQKKRNQQSNFETLLQIIALRSQPEDISEPEKIMVQPAKSGMGQKYITKSKIPAWNFVFTVSQLDVFSDNNDELEKLIGDCVGVPMIKNLDEWPRLDTVLLDISHDYRNIHFEVINDRQDDQ